MAQSVSILSDCRTQLRHLKDGRKDDRTVPLCRAPLLAAG